MMPWNSLRNALLRQFATAGWAGVVGVALIMFALAFSFSGNREREAQLADITHQRTELASDLARGTQSEVSPREILDRFRQSFPPASGLPDILLQLDASARKNGLAPRRADYGDSAESSENSSKDSGFRRMRISMPVKGSYAALRGWLSDALADAPTLSIEAIELQRPTIAAAELDAQVRLIVYMRDEPSGPAPRALSRKTGEQGDESRPAATAKVMP
ncbi:hypothetical protein GCM10027046_09240 [Uliginosibacterium flavum]|uniref:Uncharacterized protein n=1 Tax=Uliginosibacterium flavum TaxID=1396831 RepID=A0ABV2TIB3_9RHOO